MSATLRTPVSTPPDVRTPAAWTLRLNGETLQADRSRDAGVDLLGGTTATLRPLGTAAVEAILSKGDVTLTFVGSDVGLDVIAKARPARASMDIGPTAGGHVDTGGTCARSAGYANAVRKVQAHRSPQRLACCQLCFAGLDGGRLPGPAQRQRAPIVGASHVGREIATIPFRRQ